MKKLILLILLLHFANVCFSKGCGHNFVIGGKTYSYRTIIDTTMIDGDSILAYITGYGSCNFPGDCSMRQTQWNYNGFLIDSNKNSYTIRNFGTYIFTGNYENCSGIVQLMATINVTHSNSFIAVNEASVAKQIIFFPQPVTQFVQSNQQFKQIDFFDLTGKKIRELIYPQTTIDLSFLSSGCYLISGITENDEKYFSKLIKE